MKLNEMTNSVIAFADFISFLMIFAKLYPTDKTKN